MLLDAFNGREAEAVGTALAEGVVLDASRDLPRSRPLQAGTEARREGSEKLLQKLLLRVDRDIGSLKLNFFKRAKLANSFKWGLLDKGIATELVDELTQALLLRLTSTRRAPRPTTPEVARGARPRRARRDVRALHVRGAELLSDGAHAEALECFKELLSLEPRDFVARNSLGAAYARLGRYGEAEAEFRRAIGVRPGSPEAYYNLAGVLRSTGRYSEAETTLRRVLKLKPSHVDARVSLGMTSALMGRLVDARKCYEMALRAAPRNTRALVGLGQVESLEGRFVEAETRFRRALEIDPGAPLAWAALVALRKMTPADADWVARAEELANSGPTASDEAALRFSIGKYYDDIGDFARAFRAYQRANELHKLAAEPYDREGYARFIDAVIAARTPEAIASARATGSDSERPVFVLGMPRSGTSLVEQIIASHPAAHGAGEIDFWQLVVRRNAAAFWKSLPGEQVRRKLARDYLEVLAGHSVSALRVVDKTPVNATYLGIIHTTFPKARIILMRRDPIDTCLSCYFQQFPPALNWSMDLEDLAHYYRESQRVAAHWHRVLPPGTILDVPYEETVSDPEKWTRRIIEFIGLPWDPRCLEFHKTARAVATASSWQVRQKMYEGSVKRWRNYEKFIGPLRSLSDLAP